MIPEIGAPLIGVNNTSHAAQAKEHTFDLEWKKCFFPDHVCTLSSELLPFGQQQALWLPARKATFEHPGCLRGCHNPRRKMPGGRWRGMERTKKEMEQGEEKG